MSKNFKRILAIVLAVLTLSACATLAVFATADETQANSGKVCRIGAEGIGTYYGTLADAVSAANDGDVITVIKDTSVSTITVSKTITIKSANASTVSGGLIFNVGTARTGGTPGNLTISGNLKLSSNATMIDILSGTINVADEAYLSTTGNYVIDNGGGSNKAIINISGGTLKAKSAADKGVVGLFTGSGSELNISGGKIIQESDNAWAVKIPTDAEKTVNITGGELTANWGTLSLYANDKNIPDTIYTRVNISGGTIKADADSAIMFYSFARNAEVNISGDAQIKAPTKALYLWGKDAGGKDGKTTRNCVVNISGGTIETTGSYAVYTRCAENTKINITGGEITAKDQTIQFEGITDGNTDLKISGGTIISKSGDYAIQNNGKSTNLNIEISGGTVKSKQTVLHTNTDNNLKITGNAIIESENGWIIAWKSGSQGSNVEISGNAYLKTTKEKAIEVCSGDTYTVSGGTIESTTGKVFYVSGCKDFAINVTGGTVTSPKHTIYTEGASTGAINISGGTVEATNGNKALYLAHSADNMVTLDITGGTVSANITTAYDEYIPSGDGELDGKHAIFVDNDNSSKVTISGGSILGLYDTVDIRAICDVEISGDAYIYAKHDYATNFANVDLTISGGVIEATRYTLGFLGGANTVNMTGGTLIATESTVLTRTVSDMTVDVNISGDAKIYAAAKALDVQSGITYNISGGLIDVANEYKLAEETNVYAIQMKEGTLNITGGKFILGGKWASAQMIYHASANTTGKSTVNGGLFINKNTANAEVLGTNVNYISGRILYGENITGVVRGHLSAPKSVKVSYGGEEYFFCTRYAATNEAYAGAMVEGAQIRMTKGSTGMRFTTTFDEIDGATYGTLIVPAAYLANLDVFTIEALEAAGFNYLNIIANVGMTVVDGKVTINAAITNILAENYGTAFAAIAYVEIDGVYYYTAFDIYSNARSVDSVAAAALDDLKAEADEEYKYAVTAYGTTVYSPYNAYQRGVLEGFLKVTVGVPRADGATLVNTGSGAYMYFSADVNSEEYASYKASLAAVFEFVTEKDLEGNLYTTYAKGEQIVTLAYTPNTKEMRVIMESTDNTSLIEDQDYTAPEAPVATTLTQIGQWYGDTATEEHKFYTESGIGNTIGSMKTFATGNNNGMGYVIRLEDGSFIVVDGGDDSELHADNLYNVLKTQAGDGDIVIAAWIFTHAHGDHTGAFVHFTEKYSGEVTVEKFIYNIPAKNASEFGGSERSDIDKVAQCTKKYGADIIIARAGQVFEIRNAVINILYTYDMMQPYYLVDYNACSVVFNVVVENKTILFLGDAGGETDSIDGELSKMLDIYTAATLKADIAQAAHHGLDEHEKVAAFYKVVNPAQLLIPVASEYIKVNNSHYWINERSAYETCTRAAKYIAGDEVTVLTLGDGEVTTYDNVDAYKNS